MDRKKSSKPETKAKTSKKSSPDNSDKSDKSGKKDFLVVGIGASAGGVKPLQDFFRKMPADSGMAFVVILHLSREHDSHLQEILQACTAMPVTVVKDSHKVEPGNVYVIPPNRQLQMDGGVVRSTELSDERGARVAIDVFFRTLADVYEKNAVCVILSGTGTDGTLGLKAIKEANGFAIVQDPSDAEHDSMPRSAIATGLVDWILPVKQMPEKLMRFRESSEQMHLTADGGAGKVAREIQADESLREILTLLRVRTGHDFSNYKTPTLVRRIARHLQIHDLKDIPAYLEFLRENPDDVQFLLKKLLINVTNFFRDKDAWAVFEKEVVPKLFEGKGAGDTVRVWSCACASGEEAYTLAMLLHEYSFTLHDPPKIQIFATDVDEDAITEAREHFYPQSIEADVSPVRLRRFFVKEGKYYRIKKELREMVLFAAHNVLRDPPFSRLDLVTCRNLLIYLNRETQERLMQIFHLALGGHRFLFLGSSETAEAVPNLFAPFDKKQRIYTRRTALYVNYNAAPPLPISGRRDFKPPPLGAGKKPPRALSLGEIHFKLLEDSAPPSVLVNQDFNIQYLSANAGRYLQFRGGEPTNNLLKLVHPELLPDLRAALFNVQRDKKTVEYPNVHAVLEDAESVLKIIVRPVEIDNESSDYMLVLFDEDNKHVPPPEAVRKNPSPAQRKAGATENFVRRLEEELARTKDNLRATIEQHEISVEELEASNEELQAINEELRSTTEELETSKEELQSVNEELTTVNSEHREKIDETMRANSDLLNLMASTEIATIFLDRDLCIKRLTPPVEKLFNISLLDVGRPLEHFTHRLDYADLVKDAETVLKRLQPREREIRSDDGRVFLTRILPYRTLDDRIDGVVLNFLDITDRKAVENIVADDLRDTQILCDLAGHFASEHDAPALYDKILEAAIALVRADSGIIQLFDEKSQALVMLAAKNLPEKLAEHFPRLAAHSKTPSAIALATGERAFVNFDSKRTKDRDGTFRLHVEAGFLSAQATPLVTRTGNPIGMFTSYWRTSRHRPTARELRFLDLWMRQAADLIEQQLYDEALRESEARFRALVTASSDMVYKMNADWSEMHFLDGKNIVADTGNPQVTWVEKFIPAEDKQHILALIDEAVRQKKTFELEHRVMRADGEIGWAFSRAIPLIDAGGEITGWFGTARDITARRQTEQAVRFQAHLLNTVEQAIIATDLDGKVTFWNACAERLYGWTAQEAIGRDILKLTTPKAFTKQATDIMKQLRRGAGWSGEFEVARRDGTTFPAMIYNSPIEDENGKLLGIVGVSIDNTEGRKAAEAVRKSEEQLKLILESTKDYAIITYDLEGRITRWNEGARKIFGYTEEEAVGQTTHLIFTPEDRLTHVPEKELDMTLEKGRAEDERWHMRKDGSRFYASGVMQLLRDGEVEGFVKICRDQTAKLEAEQSAIEKEMLRRMVATQEDERRRIARDIHDHFGQQITALRLKLDAIRNSAGDNAELLQHTSDAQEAAAQLDANVDFIAWELRPASLDDLGLRAALDKFVTEWSSHTGIEAEFHSSALSRTRLDPDVETNLYRIAQEALNNVHKHARAKTASVLLEKTRRQISLIIEDDGVGFNVKDKANRRKGIGLIGMNERAKICGGSLEIESAKGKGTTVFARVPVKK